MALPALALALALSSGTPDLHAELTLTCGGCFGLKVDIDGDHLLFAQGVGAGTVRNSLTLSGGAHLPGLAPGTHHLKVELLQGPLDSKTYYDGPIFLRPGAKMTFRVGLDRLDEIAAPKAARAPPTDGGAAGVSLVVRTDDAAACELWLDGKPLLRFRTERVLAAERLTPGSHPLEVHGAADAVLARGSLYLGAGEEVVAGVRCQTGAFQVFTDPLAYWPIGLDAGR